MPDAFNKLKKMAQQYKNQFFNASPQWQCASILLSALALVGVSTFDWKPIAISIIFITVYIYKDKIDFIEFNSAKLKMKETLNEVQRMAEGIRDISEEMKDYRSKTKGMITNNAAAVFDDINMNASFESLLKAQKKTLDRMGEIISEIASDIENRWFEDIKNQMEKHGADFSKMDDIPLYELPFISCEGYFSRGIPRAEIHLYILANQMYLLYLESQCSVAPNDKTISEKLKKQKNKFQLLLKKYNYTI